MHPRRWIFRPLDPLASRDLAFRLRVSPVAAQVLLNRGVATPEDGRSFLAPELRHLHDPFLFRDMERAAERVRAAAVGREPIVVYGDYDVDGLTGTAVLVRLLRLLGAEVRGFIPERADGYGMQPGRVAELAAAGARVIIAVDNGTSAHAAAEAARAAGVDVVVADHHPPEDGAAPPDVHALLNPSVPGERYPFRGLCGAGVAFKLAWAIAQLCSPAKRVSPELREYLLDALSFVAIGTVADMVPLSGENRAIVRFGLRALGATRDPGLRALVEHARLAGPPTPEDVAFRIAPRLNAAGRMGEAKLGLELFSCVDAGAARAIAARLDEENRRRQTVERRVLDEALAAADEALRAAEGRAIVLAREGWPLGVLGIVASRLVERYYRPAVLVALEGAVGRGSARSVPGIALPEVFQRCRAHLVRFGGHAAAAGLEVRADRVDAFRQELARVLAERPPEADAAPPLEIDLALELGVLSRALVRELQGLAPHGRGNEPPLFAARGAALAGPPRVVGKGGDHLQMQVRHGRTVLKAVGFGMGRRADAIAAQGERGIDLAFRPMLSTFTGAETVELELRDWRAAAG